MALGITGRSTTDAVCPADDRDQLYPSKAPHEAGSRRYWLAGAADPTRRASLAVSLIDPAFAV